jgi:hypothetical protein
MLATVLYNGIILDKMRDCKVYFEIGSYDGEGITMLGSRYPEKFFYSLDPFIEDGHTAAVTGVQKGGKLSGIRETFLARIKDRENIVHFDMTDNEFIEGKVYDLISPDVMFIDGDHSYEHVALDLRIAEILASKNPLWVIMDDTVNIEGVVRALNEFKEAHLDINFTALRDYGAVYFNLP